MTSQSRNWPARRAVWGLAALVAIVALVVYVRIRLLQSPLQRDEGEYAYAGQLMLDGVPPYQLAFNMKLPGTYAVYAVIMAVFGETVAGIHFGFLLANLGAVALLFFSARRLLDFTGAVVACACYALLSLSPGTLGLEGQATHLVTLAALGGFLALLRWRESGKRVGLFCGGICFGVAFLCKQPGLYFGMFGFLAVARHGLRTRPVSWRRILRDLSLFMGGLVAPLALTCFWIWRLGTFEKFWFWTFTYARVHAGLLDTGMAWGQFVDFWQRAGWVAWSLPLAGIGLICLFVAPDRSDRKFLLGTLLVFSALAFSAAFYFTRHYYIVMLPVVGLLIGVALTTAVEALSRGNGTSIAMRHAPITLFVLICAGFIFNQRAIWFELTPNEVSRAIYSYNPFPESVEIARHIREESPPGARIAILGSEPQIYFYAHRHSASGFIYMYDLVQLHRYAAAMQEEMIRDITAVKPDYLIWCNVSSSWLSWPGADTHLRDWSWDYARQFFHREGVVYIYPTHTDYVWGPESLKERTDTSFFLGIYKRN